MGMLAHLRVQVSADSCSVSAGYRTLKLLSTLTLTDVVAQSGLLL